MAEESEVTQEYVYCMYAELVLGAIVSSGNVLEITNFRPPGI